MMLTIADLMKRWGCGNKAVLELVHTGQLAAVRVGRAYKVDLAEVLRFEHENKPPRRSQPATPEQRSIRRGVSERHQDARPAGAQTSGLRAACKAIGLDPGELGFAPDAFKIDEPMKQITLFEVVVTHGLGAGKLKKLAAFCDVVESRGWHVTMMVASIDGRYTEHDPRTGMLTERALREVAEQVRRALP